MARTRTFLIAGLTTIALAGAAFAGHDLEEPTTLIATEHVQKLLQIGEDIKFIDLRAPEEFSKGRLPDAVSIPIEEFEKRWSEIPKHARVVLYCPCPQGDRDESFAFLWLRNEGYRNISFLDGGYTEWVKRGYPIQKGSP